MLNETRPFPCIFGVAGLQSNQLRFAFSEEMLAEEIATPLEHFVINCRKYGRNTSLVVFSKPSKLESIQNYNSKFWMMLNDLIKLDKYAWPTNIPEEIDTPAWEFCFAGEPIFVVCSTPAHIKRQSRRSSALVVTFQPRWVFENLLKTERSTEVAFSNVRSRLLDFDLSAPSPHLGKYGEPEVREFRQYFLLENDLAVSCPFRSLTDSQTAKASDIEGVRYE
jgi:FPC/CPF motif-containing protein YcgG